MAVVMANELYELFNEHPEALDMTSADVQRRFWSYSKRAVATARLVAIMRRATRPLLEALTRVLS